MPDPVPPRAPARVAADLVPPARRTVDEPPATGVDELARALAAGRLDAAEVVLARVLAGRPGLAALVGRVLQPAACQALDGASPVQEARAVATVRALVARTRRPSPPGGPVVALVALPGERGLVCLDLAALLLEARGVDSVLVEGLSRTAVRHVLASLGPAPCVVLAARSWQRLVGSRAWASGLRDDLEARVVLTGFAVERRSGAAARWGLAGQAFDVVELVDEVLRLELPLGDRELAVLALVAEGLTNERIGRELGVSTGTVKARLDSAFAVLGASDRASAVAAALRRGLLR